MILAVDAGNSNIVLGCMEGLTVRRTLRLATDRAVDAAGYTAALRALLARNGYCSTDFRGAILSSVVAAVTEPLRQALSALTAAPVPVVGDTVKSAIPLRIDRPETIGADLIAAAEGALAQYAPPLILVDMGTATTFSVLDETGAFLGGTIAPGVHLGAEALVQRTGLPMVTMTAPQSPLSRSTDDCLRSGIVLGAAAMVDGMLDRLEAALGMSVTAVATGGLAGCVIPHCRRPVILDDDLLLRGLAVLYGATAPQDRCAASDE